MKKIISITICLFVGFCSSAQSQKKENRVSTSTEAIPLATVAEANAVNSKASIRGGTTVSSAMPDVIATGAPVLEKSVGNLPAHNSTDGKRNEISENKLNAPNSK